MTQPMHPVFTHSTSRCESLKLFIPHYPCINERIEFFTLTLRAPTQNRKGELLSPRSPGPILIEAIGPLSLGELIHH